MTDEVQRKLAEILLVNAKHALWTAKNDIKMYNLIKPPDATPLIEFDPMQMTIFDLIKNADKPVENP